MEVKFHKFISFFTQQLEGVMEILLKSFYYHLVVNLYLTILYLLA